LERQVGKSGHDVGLTLGWTGPHPFGGGHKDIFMPLTEDCKIGVGSPPKQTLPGPTGHDISGARPGEPMNDNDNAFGIRDGEVAIDLPKTFDASLYFIGRIRTPWTRREDCPKNARESDAICTLAIDPRWASALTHVDSCSHLVVLY